MRKLSIVEKKASPEILTLAFPANILVSDMKKVFEILESHGVIDAQLKVASNESLVKIIVQSEIVPENRESLKKELNPYLYMVK